MLFSEKMKLAPQPQRAALWKEFRILGRALVLHTRLANEGRLPTEEELLPFRKAALRANALLAEASLPPSFDPEAEDFFLRLTEELNRIKNEKQADKGDSHHDSAPNQE